MEKKNIIYPLILKSDLCLTFLIFSKLDDKSLLKKNYDALNESFLIYSNDDFFLPRSIQVHKLCGAPSIRHNEKIPSEDSLHQSNEDAIDGPSLEKKQVPPVHHGNKWTPPPDTEMLSFLTNLDKSKSISLQIANR